MVMALEETSRDIKLVMDLVSWSIDSMRRFERLRVLKIGRSSSLEMAAYWVKVEDSVVQDVTEATDWGGVGAPWGG